MHTQDDKGHAGRQPARIGEERALQFTDADIGRFMRFVDILPNGCWFWGGARSRGAGNKKWYGSFKLGNKTIRAHRFSCEALGGLGPLPPGYHRDHKCVFSLCVNPSHLQYLTHAENEQAKKDRRA